MSATDRAVIVNADMAQAQEIAFPGAEVVVFSAWAPDREEPHNEDGAVVHPLGDTLVLAVADGLGGLAGGKLACETALKCLTEELEQRGAAKAGPREAIMRGLERANAEVLDATRVGQTTLIVAEVRGRNFRTYNIGDSVAMVVGGKGKIKLQTVQHSPVGYGVAAGLIDEEEAMHHEERHFVSNAVGTDAMRIEVSAESELDPRDTLVVGSDGLFDNLRPEEIAEVIRKGPIQEAAASLIEACRDRMRDPKEGSPSKPDDLTFILYRALETETDA